MRYIDGGRDRFLDYVQLAAAEKNDEAEIFLGIYQELSVIEQLNVSFDDICAAGDIRPSVLMAAVVQAAMEYGQTVADVVAAASHPKIVRQTVKSAMRIGGQFADIAQKDRVILLQKQKFAPVPRGTTVTVNANASANARAAAAAASQPSVPSFLDDVGSLQGVKDRIQHAVSGSNDE